jgi:hypothetical protein
MGVLGSLLKTPAAEDDMVFGELDACFQPQRRQRKRACRVLGNAK